jgi:exosome complex component RRP45
VRDVKLDTLAGQLHGVQVFAAMAVLSAFRLPQAELAADGSVVVHAPEEREPLPLTIQHVPLATSFVFIGTADNVLVDATRDEAAAAVGSVVVVRDRFSVDTDEVCAVHKADGVGMQAAQVRGACAVRSLFGRPEVTRLARHREKARRPA